MVIGGLVLGAILVAAGATVWRMNFAPQPDVHFAAAEAARAAGKLDEAITEYRNTLQLEPTHYRAHWRLGQTYLAQGRTAPALAELEHAMPLAGMEPDITVDLARARIKLGQHQRALAEIEALPRPRSPELDKLADEARLALGDRKGNTAALARVAPQAP
jgi:cytochrome c-type biogenesis protein CcmH/NrfG